jgi:acetyl-CoA carboxylase biotin carboxylase subunit
MSVVRTWADLLPTFRTTRATAQAVFGDGRVYLERYLEQSRHIEVQVVADQFGSVLHLGERDCSVQRRHQKLIEESPGPNLPPGVSSRLAELAVHAAREVGYTGAGTFEFLVHKEEIAFIEVNSRIQVEHPVTEARVGIDLVREQLRVAAGLPLSVTQDEVRPNGVAIECRVNAEDPARGFAPTAGRLDEFVPPGGPFVRVDTHAFAGWRVPAEYDSLLAKVIAWAPDREQALDRMDRALAEFVISGPGVRTTIPLLREVLADKTFRSGEHTTAFLDDRAAEEGD